MDPVSLRQVKTAVVILNWNGRSLLEEFLPSVITHSGNADIYVADNASSDDSVPFLIKHYPQVKIIRNKENGGYARGYNEALKNVEADILCLLNSDVEVTENWLEPILNTFADKPDAGIIQPKILDQKNKAYFEYAGAAGGFIDRYGYPFCRGRIFQTLEKDLGQYDDNRQIFWASGACFFIRKDLFDELGGFDEDYFAHQEEIDLCWRAHNLGYKIWYISESHIYHVGGATLNNMNPKKTFFNFRNSLFSITKNLPKRRVFPLLLSRLLLDGIAAARFLFQLRPRHMYAILKAHLSFYRYFIKMFRKRKGIHSKESYYSCTSIVWLYFVKKIQFYSDFIKD